MPIVKTKFNKRGKKRLNKLGLNLLILMQIFHIPLDELSFEALNYKKKYRR
jgi:hypothetical protein